MSNHWFLHVSIATWSMHPLHCSMTFVNSNQGVWSEWWDLKSYPIYWRLFAASGLCKIFSTLSAVNAQQASERPSISWVFVLLWLSSSHSWIRHMITCDSNVSFLTVIPCLIYFMWLNVSKMSFFSFLLFKNTLLINVQLQECEAKWQHFVSVHKKCHHVDKCQSRCVEDSL